MLIITEGVCDCLAAVQMLEKENKKYRVVSLVNGSGGAVNDFQNNYEWLDTFENIFLAFDQDKAGEDAVKKVSSLFPPNKVKSLKFSENDPNDLLKANKSKEFLSSIFQAREARPDGIVSVEDIFDEAIKPPVKGLSFPWNTLTEATYGYRRKEVWGIGSGSGSGKCLLRGSKVRLFNGDIKRVEEIKIGDLLLAYNGESSRVIDLGNGIDDIYRVRQSDKSEYYVNSSHILSLIDNTGEFIDIPVKEAINYKSKLYGYNGLSKYNSRNVLIPPYILGIWLGDGHNDSPSLTCGDEEVLNEWINYGLSLGLNPTEFTGETNCRRINLSRTVGTKQSNCLYDILKQYQLPFNKHIPNDYLINSVENRLQLLAGLLDTDGYLQPKLKSVYEITTKYKNLSLDIEMLARSLGFRARRTVKVVNNINYYRISISGDIGVIPCRVPRKSGGRLAIVDNNKFVYSFCSRIISIEKVGIGEYYGFTLEGSKRFCLENYIVTHNTEFFKEVISHVINVHKLVPGVLFLEESAAKTLKVLAGKKINKRFHIPQDRGGDWTIEELVDGINDLKGKLYLYNHNGAKDWESIKSKIRFMAYSLGIKDFFLDHLTALVAQEQDEYRALNKIMEEIASLSEELDCTIFFISHLRNPSGTPHEEGGRVTVDQFKGSGAIRFWSHFLIGLERNQQAEDLDERNTTTVRILKDRDTGLSTGLTFHLKYHHDTGRWLELSEDDFEN